MFWNYWNMRQIRGFKVSESNLDTFIFLITTLNTVNELIDGWVRFVRPPHTFYSLVLLANFKFRIYVLKVVCSTLSWWWWWLPKNWCTFTFRLTQKRIWSKQVKNMHTNLTFHTLAFRYVSNFKNWKQIHSKSN